MFSFFFCLFFFFNDTATTEIYTLSLHDALPISAVFAFGAALTDRFLSLGNIVNVYEQSTDLALVSLGQTLAILTGGIDLSVGSLISLTSCLTSGLINGDPNRVMPVVLAVLAL